MQYKTIVLEFLEGHPALHARLRLSRRLMEELDRYAADLRAAHREFSRTHPPDAAAELAAAEIEARIAAEAARHGP